MRALLLCLLLLALPVAAPFAQAPASTADAYEGRVSVPDQSAASRDAALRAALAQVVSRVSGPEAPATAASLIARAPQYVQRYGFERDAAGGLLLVAAFDSRALDAQLRALGLPVWGYAAAPAGDVTLHISGLRSGAHYAQLTALLRSIPGLQALTVGAVQGDALDVVVRAEGGATRVLQVLRGSRHFAELPASPGGVSLRWLP